MSIHYLLQKYYLKLLLRYLAKKNIFTGVDSERGAGIIAVVIVISFRCNGVSMRQGDQNEILDIRTASHKICMSCGEVFLSFRIKMKNKEYK